MLVARYEAAREGYRTVSAAYLNEGRRLMQAASGLDLVHRTMRGEVLTPKSAAPAPWFPAAF
jgi:hypothetical protein